MAFHLPKLELNLPWYKSREDRLFKWAVYVFIILFMLAGMILNQMTLPEIEKKDLADVAPRLAKLILEKKKIPPPPPPPPPPPKKEVKETEPKKDKEVKKEVKVEPKPKSLPKPDSREAARKKAQKSGLIAMQDELADLRESFDFTDLDDLPQSKSGSEAEAVASAETILSNSAGRGSGGIKTNTLTRKISRSEMAQKTQARVSSSIQEKQKLASLSQPNRKSKGPIRSQEEIERVFQKNKGGIFNIYNRALRKDPTLEGKVVLELTIASDGTVTACKIISSELGDKRLEKRLVSKIKKFRFANKKVPVITVTYPIVFLPS